MTALFKSLRNGPRRSTAAEADRSHCDLSAGGNGFALNARSAKLIASARQGTGMVIVGLRESGAARTQFAR